jgi:hypothetical protein
MFRFGQAACELATEGLLPFRFAAVIINTSLLRFFRVRAWLAVLFGRPFRSAMFELRSGLSSSHIFFKVYNSPPLLPRPLPNHIHACVSTFASAPLGPFPFVSLISFRTASSPAWKGRF